MRHFDMILSSIFAAVFALAGCSDDNAASDVKDYSKFGPLVQNIVSNTPGITDIDEVTDHTLPGGIKMTEIAFKARFWNQHMYIVEVNLDGKLTIVSSTPDDLPPTGGHQTLDLHAAAAENHGKTVYLAVNGDVCGGYSVPDNEYQTCVSRPVREGWRNLQEHICAKYHFSILPSRRRKGISRERSRVPQG